MPYILRDLIFRMGAATLESGENPEKNGVGKKSTKHLKTVYILLFHREKEAKRYRNIQILIIYRFSWQLFCLMEVVAFVLFV